MTDGSNSEASPTTPSIDPSAHGSSDGTPTPDGTGTSGEPAASMTESTSPTSNAGSAPTKASRRRSSARNALEWVLVIAGAVLIALLVKTFVVQAFRIPSSSMEPTLEIGDRVLVNKLSYDAHDANRGDVVVFTRPDDLAAGPDEPEDLIKRVIGLPGDTLQIRNGSVYVNDQKLDEPYLPDSTVTLPVGNEPFTLETPFEVPDDQVFVMGDNRSNSTDGRFFGPIEEDSIIGRAFVIMWPPGRIAGL